MITEREIEILKVLKAQFTVSEIVRHAKVPGHYVSNMNKLLPETIKVPGVKKETYNNLFSELHELRTRFKGVRRDAYARQIQRELRNKNSKGFKESIRKEQVDSMIKDFVNIHKDKLMSTHWHKYKDPTNA